LHEVESNLPGIEPQPSILANLRCSNERIECRDGEALEQLDRQLNPTCSQGSESWIRTTFADLLSLHPFQHRTSLFAVGCPQR